MKASEILAKLAPTAATLLGGPFAGMAVQAIGDAFGMSDATKDKIADVLESGQMTGEQLAALKTAEQNLKLELERLNVKRDEIAAADRDSARRMQTATGSRIPGALAMLVTIGFFGILGYMLAADYKPSDALLVRLGSLGTAWSSIVGFYFGSSHGSQLKTEALAAGSRK